MSRLEYSTLSGAIRPPRKAVSTYARLTAARRTRAIVTAGVVVGLITASWFKTQATFNAQGGLVTPGKESVTDPTFILALVTAILVLGTVAVAGIPRACTKVAVGFLILMPPALWAPNTAYANVKISQMFTLSLLACLAPVIFIRARGEVVHWFIVLTAICAIHASGIFYARSEAYVGAGYGAFGSTTIALGITSGIVVVICSIAAASGRLPLLFAFPLLLLGGVALVSSGSRGPVGATALALVLVFLAGKSRGRHFRAFAMLVILVAIGVYALRLAPQVAETRIAGFFTGNVDRSALARVEYSTIAWHSVLQHPLGLGWGGFEALVQRPGIQDPHNLAMEALSEGGVLFGTAFLIWLAFIWWRSREDSVDFAGTLSFGLLSFMLFEGLTGSSNMRDSRSMFFAIGIAIAIGGLVVERPGRFPVSDR